MTVRKVRRSQIISPFGPGAIIDLVGESFVVEDAGRWRGPRVVIDFPRLASYLKVDALAAPSPSPRWPIPYYRFPQWLFCSGCRRMSRWSYTKEVANAAPSCEHCTGRKQLIPMRFVAVCANGHLSDVDWVRWAHSAIRRDRNQNQCQRPDLKFLNKANVGGGLNSLVVRCATCGGERSLDGLTTRLGLTQIGSKCSGRQPWQDQRDAVPCSEQIVAMQRGASSVYFPTVESAIDIPPDSAWSSVSSPLATLRKSSEFKFLLSEPNHELAREMIGIAARKYGLSPTEVEAALARESTDPRTPVEGGPENIRPDEWAALIDPQGNHDPKDYFISRRADRPLGDAEGAATGWGRLISDVVLVDRLREVRVLTHFERHTMKEKVPSNLGDEGDFLPAVEVFGEGFFLRLDEEVLTTWEQSGAVVDRCRKLVERHSAKGAKWLSEPTPRYVLLHTFAHVLLRNTAFEAGYSTSALRERLYVTKKGAGPAMAGVLIYTAAGDSEGTLGGLVRMGEFPRLGRLLDMSITAARWCSFDPVCADHPGQGPDGLSLAACHACSLVPETSCEATNRLLDRRLLVDPEFGFFKELAATIGGVPGNAL
ncbi:DrmB family protein [Actinosynnema sp. NPDC059335]|uniref:DrmB family protein n=1 Tax=Actinosynnema sp. NPDC059335 TaxID=3346804 RepID=UPI00366F1912